MKPSVVISAVVFAAVVVVLAFHAAPNRGRDPAAPSRPAVATTVDTSGNGAAQVITITAKGGYTPEAASAKAGVPLVLKIKTDGTFDCSAELRIPALNWSQNLKPTEEISVPVPAQKAGTTLVGMCSMGMYHFKITFE